MEDLTFSVVVEKDEDGIYVANVPSISGCFTQGKTFEEAMERIKEAIEVCVESEKDSIVPMKFVGLREISLKNE